MLVPLVAAATVLLASSSKPPSHRPPNIHPNEGVPGHKAHQPMALAVRAGAGLKRQAVRGRGPSTEVAKGSLSERAAKGVARLAALMEEKDPKRSRRKAKLNTARAGANRDVSGLLQSTKAGPSAMAEAGGGSSHKGNLQHTVHAPDEKQTSPKQDTEDADQDRDTYDQPVPAANKEGKLQQAPTSKDVAGSGLHALLPCTALVALYLALLACVSTALRPPEDRFLPQLASVSFRRSAPVQHVPRMGQAWKTPPSRATDGLSSSSSTSSTGEPQLPGRSSGNEDPVPFQDT